ncbi:MAG: winged helix-turn-helix domain-containing protein [Flavobacteriaceae bacterium]
MGKGHAELLQALTSNPSLRQVAKQRKMSYSKAWKLMKHLNQKATAPVVVMAPGGKQGGQTTLTPFGQKLLAHYWKTHQQYAIFLENEINPQKSTHD